MSGPAQIKAPSALLLHHGARANPDRMGGGVAFPDGPPTRRRRRCARYLTCSNSSTPNPLLPLIGAFPALVAKGLVPDRAEPSVGLVNALPAGSNEFEQGVVRGGVCGDR